MWARIVNAFRVILRRNAVERELDDEVRFHLEMQTQDNVRRGMTPRAARDAAHDAFGGVERVKEQSRDARGARFIETLGQDIRFAWRTLRSNPGFAGVAVLTLGLGIGANTAIFSVINGVLLRPLPYANEDRLVLIRQSAPGTGRPIVNLSIREYFDYREQGTADFDALVEYHQMSFDLLKRGEPDRVNTGVVSHNFFDTLGISPILGRTFVADDDKPGAEAVLILSYSYWQTKFGADPRIVGQVFEMNDRPHTVIGVLPNVPHYPAENDVYMPVLACPFRASAETRIAQNRRIFGALVVFGKLKPGVTRERAAKGVEAICGRFTKDNPRIALYRPESGFMATALDVRGELTRTARPMLLILMGTTGLVLLLACANVANLMLARLLRRDREMALRTAVGAGRGRLIRQLLTESTLLSLAGSAVGLVFAYLTLDLLVLFVGRFTARTGEVAIDPQVLTFTLAVAMVTGMIFGTLPALGTRVDLVTALKESKGATSSAGHRRLQSGLIVVQVAVSVVLLVSAGLLLVSFLKLQQIDPGYKTERLLSAEAFGNFSKYPQGTVVPTFYVPLLERLAQQPGIVAAAVTNAVPFVGAPGSTPFQIEGHQNDNPDRRPTADINVASPRYFDALGIPVVTGRSFSEMDHDEAPRVAIVNRSMLRYWEGREPIGSRISLDNGQTWLTLVGVVGDVRQYGLDQEAVAQVYIPLRQSGGLAGRILVRTNGEPLQAAGMIRQAVHAIDPDMPIENVTTLEDLRSTSLARPRLTAILLAIFAGLALFVTLTGITGVIATSVSQRTHEFGVRMALGAEPGSVLRLVLRQGMVLVLAGLAVGVVGSLVVTRVLSGLLFGVQPTDPFTFVSVALLLVAVAAAACFVPARRATRVQPVIALRST